ncbi:unnamed protein product [Paramecium sonneborni]|uniref:Uncharacterized protein n=1 Tax=Paramecium sonneborni TaxID=65129 RepID=A0A8S1Q1K6_9CILI|nr:unnamed protein product [Paramecium sonneborni]
MRKRLGAFHADSIEQFMQLSQQTQELTSNYKLKGNLLELKQIQDTDKDTNTSTQGEEIDLKEYQNINILIVDNTNQIEDIFKYCDTPIEPKFNYHLEYCSKVETSNQKQNHFHFWIINQESPLYSDLINVYFTIADAYIYLYSKSMELEFQQFTEKVRLLHNNKISIIYKIVNSKRISSMNNFQDKESIKEVTLQSLDEVLKRIKDQYF